MTGQRHVPVLKPREARDAHDLAGRGGGERHVPVLKPPEERVGLPDGAAVALLFAALFAPWIGVFIAGSRPPSDSSAAFSAALLPLYYFFRLWPPWRSARWPRWLLLGGIAAFLTIVAAAGFPMALIDRGAPLSEKLAWLGTIALAEILSLLGVCLICKKLLQLIGAAPERRADR
jgi:hypothetical protein